MLRPLSNRVLLRPIVQESGGLIVDPDPAEPVIGEVVAVGPSRCSCGEPVAAELVPGAYVVMRPNRFQEVTVDGDVLWMVDLADVIATVADEDVRDTEAPIAHV